MKAGGGQSWTERKGGARASSLGPWGRVRGTPAAGEWGGGGGMSRQAGVGTGVEGPLGWSPGQAPPGF